MKYRDEFAVILLPFITFGIYAIYWLVRSKIEMNQSGTKIPTAWWLVVPLLNIYWLWKFSQGLEKITNKEITSAISFLLITQLGLLGAGIIQNSINKSNNSVQ